MTSTTATAQYQALAQPSSKPGTRPQGYQQHTRFCGAKLRAGLVDIIDSICKACAGTKTEEPKVVLYKGIWPKTKKCLVHILPLLTTTVLVSLNLASFFIGREYEGHNGTMWQNFDALALQVAAKLFELSIIASLATVLLDAVRHELLTGSSGLPFGLLASKAQFSDILFIFSPSFRASLRGLPWRKGLLFGVMIVTFSLMALLAGPSSALLAIPQLRTDWRMGGAEYFLLGTEETLWPSNLDQAAIGPSRCRTTDARDIISQGSKTSVCLWSGFTSMIEFFGPLANAWYTYPKLTIHDADIMRALVINGSTVATVHLATIWPTEVLKLLWYQAIIQAPAAKLLTTSKFTNVRSRVRDSNVYQISSQVPVVQTNCNLNQSVTYASMIGNTYYPLQPKDGSAIKVGARYTFDTSDRGPGNVSIATTWLDSYTIVSNKSDSTQDDLFGLSSAYLNVKIPVSDSSHGTLVTCSIDARWVGRTIKGLEADASGKNVVYHVDTAGFVGESGGYGRRVHLDSKWLYALTPHVDDDKTNGWTLLSVLFRQVELLGSGSASNLTAKDWSQVRTKIESMVSAWVADAMSRSGLLRNSGEDDEEGGVEFSLDLAPSTRDQTYNEVLQGTYSLQAYHDVAGNDTVTSRLYWSVIVSGLGYHATTTPYYLAIALLLTHAVIAILHIIWTIFRAREVSSAWSSLTDLLSLTLGSTPPDPLVLHNASVGIEQHVHFSRAVRIRVNARHTGGYHDDDSSETTQFDSTAADAGTLELTMERPGTGKWSNTNRVVAGRTY